MGFSITTLNNIRNQASATYQERIPVASQENLLSVGMALKSYPETFNEFISALINKIGKTILEFQLFNNDLAEFKSGTILSQQDVEEIFIEMSKAEGVYDPDGKNPLGRRNPPDVKVIYHTMNRQDYYCISIGDIDFVRVFRTEATLDEFIAGLFNSVYSGANYDEYEIMKNLLATYDGYFNYQVPEINDSNAETSCKRFVKTLKKAILDVSFASTKYNREGVRTWSKANDLVLFVHKDIVAEVDVEVLAKAFNIEKVTPKVKIKVVDDFGSLENTYALLTHKRFFRVFDTLSHMEPQRNAQGLFTNYFYHIHQILSVSPFKNAVRFTTEEITETSEVTETGEE